LAAATLPEIVEKLSFRALAIEPDPPMMIIETTAAISPYSIAVAPR